MEENIYLAFIFTFSFRLRDLENCTILILKILYQQTIINLPWNANEVLRFVKHVPNLGFSGKLRFFSRKNLIFSKIGEGGKFAVDCV